MSYKKMKPGVKKRWLKALRSGEYKQGKGWLCQVDTQGESECFCCLGVLIDIEYDGDWLGSAGGCHEPDILWGIEDAQNGPKPQRAVLPKALEQAYGLSEAATTDLMNMNDRGRGFEGIADWIEKHL